MQNNPHIPPGGEGETNETSTESLALAREQLYRQMMLQDQGGRLGRPGVLGAGDDTNASIAGDETDLLQRYPYLLGGGVPPSSLAAGRQYLGSPALLGSALAGTADLSPAPLADDSLLSRMLLLQTQRQQALSSGILDPSLAVASAGAALNPPPLSSLLSQGSAVEESLNVNAPALLGSALAGTAGLSPAPLADDSLLSRMLLLQRQQALSSGLLDRSLAVASAGAALNPTPLSSLLSQGSAVAASPNVNAPVAHANNSHISPSAENNVLRLYDMHTRNIAHAMLGGPQFPPPSLSHGGDLFSGHLYQNQLQNLPNRNLPYYRLPEQHPSVTSNFGELPERIERTSPVPIQHEPFGGQMRDVGGSRPLPKQKKRRKPRKKPADMPRRPLSAYNLFFSDERQRILQELESPLGDDSYDDEEEEDIVVPGAATPAEGTSTTQDTSGTDAHIPASQRPFVRATTTRRVHRKTHGKISFKELATMVGQRWKAISDEKRKHYQDLAAKDLARHKKAMEEYYKKRVFSDQEHAAKKKKPEKSSVKEPPSKAGDEGVGSEHKSKAKAQEPPAPNASGD